MMLSMLFFTPVLAGLWAEPLGIGILPAEDARFSVTYVFFCRPYINVCQLYNNYANILSGENRVIRHYNTVIL